MTGIVPMFSLELLELIPARLLIRQIYTPLDIDERAGIATAFDLVAQPQRPALRMLFVVGPNLKACCLSLKSSLAIFERRDRLFSHTVRREQRITGSVAIER